jgi:hypothetical protein
MMDVDLDSDGFFKVRDVQLADLEDAVILGPDGVLAGCLCGHDFWRSPEAWARARQDLSSDVFSLGIVVRFGLLAYMTLVSLTKCRQSTSYSVAWPSKSAPTS